MRVITAVLVIVVVFVAVHALLGQRPGPPGSLASAPTPHVA